MVFLAGMAVSCGSSDDSGTSGSAAERTPTGDVEATTIDQLGLTGALNVDLPDALEESSSSLRLVGQKSMEACLMKESAKQMSQQIAMASSMLCHIEVDAAAGIIPWGQPTILDFSAMEAAMGVTLVKSLICLNFRQFL